MPTATTATGGPKAVAPGAGYALALLLCINLFNYIDRQILSATLPKIGADASIFEQNDPNKGFKLGLLTTGFIVSYMLLSPLFGRLSDRISRWVLVGLAVMAWSLATGGTGLAVGYILLLLTRCLVGVGEAGYGPIAPSMLSDLYPVDRRGRVMSWFYMAIPVGSALGFVIGGQVADTSWGWRGAFLVVVIPGLVLGVLCFFMREPRVHLPSPEKTDEPSPRYSAVVKELLKNRSFLYCCAGMTMSTFVLGGVAAWAPSYIFKREGRFSISPAAETKLRELKRSDGSPEISEDVVQRFHDLIAADEIGSAAFEERLSAKFTHDELKNIHSHLDEAATAPGSITTGKIGLYFGGIVVVSGLVATILGGLLGDWLRNRGVKGAYFHVAGWGTVIAFPFFVGMLYVPFPLAWVFMFIAVFWLFFNTGPANTILANVTRADIRSNAFAINILLIHALGDAISPPIIGSIEDRSSLHIAFLAVSFLIPVAGLLWVMGAKHLDADTAAADQPLGSSQTTNPT